MKNTLIVLSLALGLAACAPAVTYRATVTHLVGPVIDAHGVAWYGVARDRGGEDALVSVVACRSIPPTGQPACLQTSVQASSAAFASVNTPPPSPPLPPVPTPVPQGTGGIAY